MFYIIDFDTLLVECKHENGELLTRYINYNGLADAVALVGDTDELEFAFTDKEIAELIINLGGKEPDDLWGLLNSSETIPTYTTHLGKKLVKNNPKQDSSETTTLKPKGVVKTRTRTRIELNLTDELTFNDNKCKKGSIQHTIVTAIDEMCSTVLEVHDYIISNHICGNGRLSDSKYAYSKIKDLIKSGKLKVIGNDL